MIVTLPRVEGSPRALQRLGSRVDFFMEDLDITESWCYEFCAEKKLGVVCICN